MKTSIFDLFKIGIGPSSSHTVGPMRAAFAFLKSLDLGSVTKVRAELYGSLALTGIGHGTDRAVLLGLMGESPETVPVECVVSPERLSFAYELLFHKDQLLPAHSNGMKFSAYGVDDDLILSQVYYSVGGGFIVREGESAAEQRHFDVPYPFTSAGAGYWRIKSPIAEIMMANEGTLRSPQAVREGIFRIWDVMKSSIERGLTTEGILPGGLKVRRRAKRLYEKVRSQRRRRSDVRAGLLERLRYGRE